MNGRREQEGRGKRNQEVVEAVGYRGTRERERERWGRTVNGEGRGVLAGLETVHYDRDRAWHG